MVSQINGSGESRREIIRKSVKEAIEDFNRMKSIQPAAMDNAVKFLFKFLGAIAEGEGFADNELGGLLFTLTSILAGLDEDILQVKES